MSELAMRAAVEGALKDLGWIDQTSWENRSFTPTTDEPYQRVTCGFARPEHQENTGAYTQKGWMQVDLMFPSGEAADAPSSGAGPATTRALEIKAAFPRKRSILKLGVVTQIDEAAEIMTGRPMGDRFVIPVVIRFSAQVQA